MPNRCEHRLPGLGRCHDTSGLPHGHWYRPDAFESHFHLTREEANELLRYMRHQYLNPNTYPSLCGFIDRVASA